jgi:hypothetical protein
MTTRSSAARARVSPQSSAAPSGNSQRLTYEAMRLAIDARIEVIREDLANLAPYGFQARVASVIRARKERVSREIQRAADLTLRVFLAEIQLHREEGRGTEADRLLAALNEGQPIRLSTDRGIVIRLRDGQMFLDLEKP